MPQNVSLSRGSVVVASSAAVSRLLNAENVKVGSDAMLIAASSTTSEEIIERVIERAAEIVAEKAQT